MAKDFPDYTEPRLYRIYHMDAHDGIETVSVIEAITDDDAVRQARAILSTLAGEVWLDNRLIDRVIP